MGQFRSMLGSTPSGWRSDGEIAQRSPPDDHPVGVGQTHSARKRRDDEDVRCCHDAAHEDRRALATGVQQSWGVVSDCGQPSVDEPDHPGDALIWVIAPLKGVGDLEQRVAVDHAAQHADPMVEFVGLDAVAGQDGPDRADHPGGGSEQRVVGTLELRTRGGAVAPGCSAM